MPCRILIPTVLASALSLAWAAPDPSRAPRATAAVPAGEGLDQKRIHAEYNEGNFERVIASLEGYMARHTTYSHADSVFIAKHLAVVYSASPETREKGKYYMYRLLALLPSAKLVDMYVSDEIDRIFDKVREEFVARQKSFGVDTARISLPPKAGPAPALAAAGTASAPAASGPATPAPAAKERKRNAKPFYLAAGGVALVAAGVTSYLMLAESPKKTEKIYDIP